jgi:SsrA-binding protein
MAKGSNLITVNCKAYHDYHIQESFETGIVLKGSEIKSIRAGEVKLGASYDRPEIRAGCTILGSRSWSAHK